MPSSPTTCPLIPSGHTGLFFFLSLSRLLLCEFLSLLLLSSNNHRVASLTLLGLYTAVTLMKHPSLPSTSSPHTRSVFFLCLSLYYMVSCLSPSLGPACVDMEVVFCSLCAAIYSGPALLVKCQLQKVMVFIHFVHCYVPRA